jgi:prepilin-type N-terminal cleavage/methylation domain-containing protein
MKKGFTLIELLIVVAIIAILAAIAVPNFLEAQTRAKISRSKADLRTIAVAVESYVVDYNTIPLDGDDNNQGSVVTFRDTTPHEVSRDSDIFPSCTSGQTPGSGLLRERCYNFRTYNGWKSMTSPIAYLSSIYIEPYSQFIPYAHYDEVTNANPPSYCMLLSCGPDRTISNDSSQIGDVTGNPSGFGGRLISGFPSAPSNLARALNNVYDPSNGTVSYGEVYRLCAIRDIDNFYSFSKNNENGHGWGFPLNGTQ